MCRTPDCDCLQIPLDAVETQCADPGSFLYTFTVKNLSSYTWEHLYFYFPPIPGIDITPQYIDIPTTPPGGQTGPHTVLITTGQVPGSQFCFVMSAHDQFLLECCSEEVCATIPECGSPATSVPASEGVEPTARLFENEPNPFQPPTTIRFELAEPTGMRLEVFDAGGRRLRTLLEGVRSAGQYAVPWDGRGRSVEIDFARGARGLSAPSWPPARKHKCLDHAPHGVRTEVQPRARSPATSSPLVTPPSGDASSGCPTCSDPAIGRRREPMWIRNAVAIVSSHREARRERIANRGAQCDGRVVSLVTDGYRDSPLPFPRPTGICF